MIKCNRKKEKKRNLNFGVESHRQSPTVICLLTEANQWVHHVVALKVSRPTMVNHEVAFKGSRQKKKLTREHSLAYL
jgi:hypothetical protein